MIWKGQENKWTVPSFHNPYYYYYHDHGHHYYRQHPQQQHHFQRQYYQTNPSFQQSGNRFIYGSILKAQVFHNVATIHFISRQIGQLCAC